MGTRNVSNPSIGPHHISHLDFLQLLHDTSANCEERKRETNNSISEVEKKVEKTVEEEDIQKCAMYPLDDTILVLFVFQLSLLHLLSQSWAAI